MTAHDFFADDIASFLLGRGFVAVPMHVNAVGHFELAAEVNGQVARLVLDTGASHTVFATASATRGRGMRSFAASHAFSWGHVAYATPAGRRPHY